MEIQEILVGIVKELYDKMRKYNEWADSSTPKSVIFREKANGVLTAIHIVENHIKDKGLREISDYLLQ